MFFWCHDWQKTGPNQETKTRLCPYWHVPDVSVHCTCLCLISVIGNWMSEFCLIEQLLYKGIRHNYNNIVILNTVCRQCTVYWKIFKRQNLLFVCRYFLQVYPGVYQFYVYVPIKHLVVASCTVLSVCLYNRNSFSVFLYNLHRKTCQTFEIQLPVYIDMCVICVC